MDSERKIIFATEDYLILESYKTLTYGLSDYLGEGYEIVLHSLENYDSSVIAIINGQHTGRKIGSPVTDLALKMLAKIEKSQGADYTSYFNVNKNGEMLKSTTIAIRGSGQKVIGLLCMNFYLSTPLFSILKSISPDFPIAPQSATENYSQNANDLLSRSISEAKEAVYNDGSISSNNKNKAIVDILYEQGIFNFKDSILKLSEELCISKNTVYMHLRNLKKEMESTN